MKTKLKQLGTMFTSLLFNWTGKANTQIKNLQPNRAMASHGAKPIVVTWSPNKGEFKIIPRIQNGAKQKALPLMCRAHDRPVEMKFTRNAKTHRGHDAKIYECLQCGRYDVVGVNFSTGAPMILSSGFNQAARGKGKVSATDWTPGMTTALPRTVKSQPFQTHRMAALGIVLALICFAATAGAVPATPTSPTPGTTSSPGTTLASSTVTVSWGASSGATYYDLGIRDVATGNLVVNTTTTATSYTVTLTAGKQYRWNVAAGNSAGESAFTTVLYFQTPAVIVIPATPTSPSPGTTSSPGTTLSSSTVTVSWNAVAGATYYDLGIRDVATGNLVVNTTTTATSYTVTLTAGKQYRWNVAAGNTAGESAFTTVLYFQTPIPIPATPTSPTPGTTSSPGTTLSSSTVTVSWNAVAGATYYDLGIRDVVTGNLVVNTTTTATSYTVTLPAGGQYRWNVAAGSTAGESAFTAVLYFQTPIAIPATPTSPSPGTTSSPGTTLSSSTVTVSWNAVAGATYYDLGIRDVATGNLVVNTTTTATSYTVTLPTGGQYRWNVAAGNTAGESAFTTVLFFQTPVAIPAMPTSPIPGTTSSPGPTQASNVVTVSWNAVAGATYYDLGIRDVASGNLVVNTTTTTTSYTATLTPNEQYRWNVAAGNTAGESAFTTVLYFQTPAVIAIPATPTSPTPGTTGSPGTTLSSSTVTVSWNAVAGATYYDLGIRDVATGNLVVNTTTTATNYTVTLTAGKQYRWNVAAGNTAGESAFTTVLYFQTPAALPSAQVTGTQGLGLRLRTSPDLSATVLAVMPEGSIVNVLGGTQAADGYVWWQIQYGAQQGWAANQFLTVLSANPTPAPATPTNLRQLQADGITVIPSAGIATNNTITLAAIALGSITQQFNVQFELRPSNVPFSSPTCESSAVAGGSEARVTVGGLSNQDYHWRAQVLNASGQASGWVQFGNGGADFTVNVPQLPSAFFQWNPSLVLSGQSVQFTAASASIAGLSFQWNFGDGQATSGSTVSHTFSQAGQTTVTLTVSSAQGNSSHSEVIPIASQQVLDSINSLVQRTTNLLNQVLVEAQQCAEAADYFQEGVDAAPSQIGLSAAFDAMSLGRTDAEVQDWIKLSLKQNVVVEGHTALVKWISAWILDHHANGSQSYANIFIPNLQTFVAQKNAELEQMRQQAIAAAASLTPTQAAQLAQNLIARSAGNIALATSYADKASLPNTFADLKQTDENSWTYIAGEHLFDLSVGLGLLAAGDDVHGFTAVMLSVSSTAGLGTLDSLKILEGQDTDAQMLGLSINVLSQATLAAKEIVTNAEFGLQTASTTQPTPTPTGSISVTHIAQGSLDSFGFSPRWFTTSARADVAVTNSGTMAADYRVEAIYANSFTTTQLLPFQTFGIGERSYAVNVLSEAGSVHLNPGEGVVMQIWYKSPDGGGQLPNGLIAYTLIAKTANGDYLAGTATGQFGTTLIDSNGVAIDHSSMPNVLLAANPLRSTLVSFGRSPVCNLAIYVQNPLESPLLLNLQQGLPAGTVVVDAAGGIVSSNQLVWDINLPSGASQLIQLTLCLPSSQSVLPDTGLSAYDNVTASWTQFASTPNLIQVQNWPASQLQAIGLTTNGFAFSAQHFVPGVYQVQWTTNFTIWNPLSTSTNSQGIIQIQDSKAASMPGSFYRTVKTQ